MDKRPEDRLNVGRIMGSTMFASYGERRTGVGIVSLMIFGAAHGFDFTITWEQQDLVEVMMVGAMYTL